MEDPLTGDVPHRMGLEEEDEEQAQGLVAQYDVAPEVQWAESAEAADTLVVLVGQAPSLLVGTLFQQPKAVGQVTVPQLQRLRSPWEEEYGGSTAPPMHTSTIYSLGGGTLLLGCPQPLAQEQAAAWTQGVLAALHPGHVVVAATLPAMDYRGPGSPADEDLIFSMHTSAAATAAEAAVDGSDGSGLPPALPPGTLLGGLPAALVAQCQLEGLPAAVVVAVQMGPSPEAQLVCSLAHALSAAMGSVGGSAASGAGKQQSPAQLQSAIAAATDVAYRSSAANSIFI